jgi:hypothetical protein
MSASGKMPQIMVGVVASVELFDYLVLQFQRFALNKANRERSKSIPPKGACFASLLVPNPHNVRQCT